MMSYLAAIVSFLILALGVPSRFKYYWQGSKVRRRRSAKDVSRKFYLVSWIIYVLQIVHNTINEDWVNVAFWFVGVFTVSYCIAMCYRYRHVRVSFWRWVADSFRGAEEGGFWG